MAFGALSASLLIEERETKEAFSLEGLVGKYVIMGVHVSVLNETIMKCQDVVKNMSSIWNYLLKKGYI